jgi:spoIIIJ-associated protein
MSESNEDELVEDESWDPETSEDESGEGDSPDSDGDGTAATGEAGEAGEAGDTNGDTKRRRRRRRPRSDDAPLPDDERARQALDFVTKLMVQMQMECSVRARRPKPEEPAELQLEISGRDAGRVIGKKGQVLAAVQYLTNRIVNRPGLDRRYVTVDAEGYRSRRDSTLATMAQRLGKQAVDEGKIITFHLALAKFEGVVTKSEGEGDDRRVQIIPVRR